MRSLLQHVCHVRTRVVFSPMAALPAAAWHSVFICVSFAGAPRRGAPANDTQKEENYRCEDLRVEMHSRFSRRKRMAGSRLYHLYPNMYPAMIDIDKFMI